MPHAHDPARPCVVCLRPPEDDDASAERFEAMAIDRAADGRIGLAEAYRTVAALDRARAEKKRRMLGE